MGDESLLRPLDTPPAYAVVVDRVRRSIALGVVAPGEKLPSERALAAGLGVSRVTVREALRVLQGEGLIVTKRGGAGGAIVLPRPAAVPAGGLSRRDVERVFEYRLAIETAAARLATERRADGDVAVLEECQRVLLASEDAGTFRGADSRFHLAIADASGNELFRQSIEDARAIAFHFLDARPFRVRRETTAAGHAAVLDAIARRCPERAAAAMAQHLDTACREVLEELLGA